MRSCVPSRVRRTSVVSVMAAMPSHALAERFTGIETDLTLLEWSDSEPPADAATESRGAGHVRAYDRDRQSRRGGVPRDRREWLLARVGAYYHDIGKLAKPQYFVENQPKGRNPHDSSSPTRARRSFGTTCARGSSSPREKLPRALRAFITEHHGTGTITYFLEKRASARRRRRTPPTSSIPARSRRAPKRRS